MELVNYIFQIPGVKAFLSEKLCQDPLEKFFGCQRQRGGVNDNPNVQQFCANTQALRVINSVCGNVRRQLPWPEKNKAHRLGEREHSTCKEEDSTQQLILIYNFITEFAYLL